MLSQPQNTVDCKAIVTEQEKITASGWQEPAKTLALLGKMGFKAVALKANRAALALKQHSLQLHQPTGGPLVSLAFIRVLLQSGTVI